MRPGPGELLEVGERSSAGRARSPPRSASSRRCTVLPCPCWKYSKEGFLSPPMFASRIVRSIGTGACGSTYAMFSAYALRVIMFAPKASPVVKRQRTWHIGPTTCVFASRRTAKRDSSGDVGLAEELAHRRHLLLDPARRVRARLARVLQTKQDARVILSAIDIRSAAAGLGDRLRAALHRGGQAALGVRERDDDLLVRAAGLDDVAVLRQLVLAERDRELRDRDRDRDEAGHRLGRLRLRLEVDFGQAERLLARRTDPGRSSGRRGIRGSVVGDQEFAGGLADAASTRPCGFVNAPNPATCSSRRRSTRLVPAPCSPSRTKAYSPEWSSSPFTPSSRPRPAGAARRRRAARDRRPPPTAAVTCGVSTSVARRHEPSGRQSSACAKAAALPAPGVGMTATLIDGKALGAKVREEVAASVAELGHVGLATILVGDDPASHIYIDLKQKAATAGRDGGARPQAARRHVGGGAARARSPRSTPTTRSTGSSSSCRCRTTSTRTGSSRRSRPRRTSTGSIR